MKKRLAPGVVRAIRHAPCSTLAAAREFQVTASTVTNIRKRLVHADVPDEWPATGRSRLTPEQVREIRTSKATLADLADRYGRSITAIHMIRKRQQIYLDID